jgi:hypothetical protein
MSINHEKHIFVGFIVTIFYSVNIFRESGVLLDEFYATIILGEFTQQGLLNSCRLRISEIFFIHLYNMPEPIFLFIF